MFLTGIFTMQIPGQDCKNGTKQNCSRSFETHSPTLECGHQTKGQQNKTTSRFVLLTLVWWPHSRVGLRLSKLPSQFSPSHSYSRVLVFTWWKCQQETFPSFETLSKFSVRNSAFSNQNRTELEGNCTISQEIMKDDLEKSVSKIRRNSHFWAKQKFLVLSRSSCRSLEKDESFPGAQRALNGKTFRLLLKIRQQLRESHQQFLFLLQK